MSRLALNAKHEMQWRVNIPGKLNEKKKGRPNLF